MKWEKCKKSPVDCAISHQNNCHFSENSFSDKRSNGHAFGLFSLAMIEHRKGKV